MSYVPSEEALGQYDEPEASLASKYKDYLQGLSVQTLQQGANAGREIGMLPSYAYEAATGKPGYSLKKSDLSEFIPDSESGQTGKNIGGIVSDIASYMIPGHAASRGLRALSRYHPFTRGQMGNQFNEPINAAEQAGVRAPLSYHLCKAINLQISSRIILRINKEEECLFMPKTCKIIQVISHPNNHKHSKFHPMLEKY